MERGFIKDPDRTIKDLVATKIPELGENIVIRRSPATSLANRWIRLGFAGAQGLIS